MCIYIYIYVCARAPDSFLTKLHCHVCICCNQICMFFWVFFRPFISIIVLSRSIQQNHIYINVLTFIRTWLYKSSTLLYFYSMHRTGSNRNYLCLVPILMSIPSNVWTLNMENVGAHHTTRTMPIMVVIMTAALWLDNGLHTKSYWSLTCKATNS